MKKGITKKTFVNKKSRFLRFQKSFLLIFLNEADNKRYKDHHKRQQLQGEQMTKSNSLPDHVTLQQQWWIHIKRENRLIQFVCVRNSCFVTYVCTFVCNLGFCVCSS